MADGVQPAAAGGAPGAEGTDGYEGKGGTPEEDKRTPTPNPGTTGKPWKETEGGTKGAGVGVKKAEEEEVVEGRKEGACGCGGRAKPGGGAAAKEGKQEGNAKKQEQPQRSPEKTEEWTVER